ncbi:MAG: 2-phospho-L-lactate transferase CofD family protein [Minisyncoccales bacterium]
MAAQKNKKLKIVCLGGGNLVPKVLLEPLKSYPVLLTGITSMVDSGGAASVFRRQFDVLSPGDIRRHVLALSNAPKWKKDLWQFRFGDEFYGAWHKGQSFGNAFIAGLEWNLKSHKKAMAIVSEFMELKSNRALPMTVDKTNIIAELEDGSVIEGEQEIELAGNHDANLKIKKIFQKPGGKIFPEAKKVISEADLILIGPGDLYSSTVPCFLPKDAPAAFKKAKGKKILISNSVSRKGETHGFSIGTFAAEVEKYMRSDLDYILYHNKPVDEDMLAEYEKKELMICEPIKIDNDLSKDKFIGADILKKDEFAYDPKKVVREIFKLINYKR